MTFKPHSPRSWAADANILYTVVGTIVSRFVSCVASVFAIEAAQTFLPDNVLAPYQNSALLWFILAIGTASRLLYLFWAGQLRPKLSAQQENLLFTFLVPCISLVLAWLPGYRTLGITSTILFALCHVLLGLCAGCEVPTLALQTIKLHQHKNYAAMLLSISTSLGISLLTLTNPRSTGLRFVYLSGGIMGLVGLCIRLSLTPWITLWHDEALVSPQVLQRKQQFKLIFERTRHLLPLFIGLALFGQTYAHATGRGWKEMVERLAYPCAPQAKNFIWLSVMVGIGWKICTSILGEKYGTVPVFLSSCWLSVLTLPLLYALSYLNYPALGLIIAALPASIFQCLLYRYKLDIAQQVPVQDIALCWNAVFSLVAILGSSIPSFLCFHPAGGIHLLLLYSGLNALFILASHHQLQHRSATPDQ